MTRTAITYTAPQLPLWQRLHLRHPSPAPRRAAGPRDRDDPAVGRALARLPEDLRHEILRDL